MSLMVNVKNVVGGGGVEDVHELIKSVRDSLPTTGELTPFSEFSVRTQEVFVSAVTVVTAYVGLLSFSFPNEKSPAAEALRRVRLDRVHKSENSVLPSNGDPPDVLEDHLRRFSLAFSKLKIGDTADIAAAVGVKGITPSTALSPAFKALRSIGHFCGFSSKDYLKASEGRTAWDLLTFVKLMGRLRGELDPPGIVADATSLLMHPCTLDEVTEYLLLAIIANQVEPFLISIGKAGSLLNAPFITHDEQDLLDQELRDQVFAREEEALSIAEVNHALDVLHLSAIEEQAFNPVAIQSYSYK